MNRRTLLQTMGAVGGAAVLAGCNFDDAEPSPADGTPTEGTPATADSIPYSSEFANVVNVVEAGAETDGKKPIDPVLEREAGNDTLLYFPQGRYLLADTMKLHEFTNFGMVGRGATFTTPPAGMVLMFSIGIPGSASGFLFEGFEFDLRGVEQTPRPLVAKVDDGLTVRDVSATGPTRIFRFDVTSEDGAGLVERLKVTQSPDDFFAVGCLVTPLSKGRMTFRDCHVEGFPNNGLYVSPSRGPVRVLGGTFANNGIANVRVGANSVVRGVTVRGDTTDSRFANMRGIWARKGRNIRIENCDIRYEQVPSSDGALVMAGEGSVRNVDIQINAASVNALLVHTPGSPGRSNSSEPSVSFEGLNIEGSAPNHSAIRISNQDNCLFDGLTVRQTGVDRDGITIFRSRNNVLRNADITVTGRPIVTDESTLERGENVNAVTLKNLDARGSISQNERPPR